MAAAGVIVIDNSSRGEWIPSCRWWSQKSTLTPCAPFPRDRRESELHDDGRDAGAEAVARRGRTAIDRCGDVSGRERAGREGVDELSNQLEKSTATTCAPSPSTGPRFRWTPASSSGTIAHNVIRWRDDS